jgi:hypothetical protein
MRIAVAAGALATCLVFSADNAAAAEPRKGHSEYLSSLTTRSLREGFPARSVRLLDVGSGPGREASAKALTDLLNRDGMGRRLKLGDLKPDPRQKRILTHIGEQGYLDAIGDGSKLRVRALIDDPKEIERAGTRRIGKAALEKLGQRFVRGPLAPAVKLGPNEKLTVLGVRYLYNSEGSAEAGRSAEKQQVIANIAIFGREVGGVPVVGPGSKVAVWFDNSRLPVGFDVDWPEYRVSTTNQPILPRAELNRRVAATTVPLKGAGNAKVHRFECGYVDLGATRRGKYLQGGCSIAYGGRAEQGTVWARTEYIPAAVEVLKEDRWPLANALAEGNIVNTASAEFQRYMTGPKAPPEEPPAQQ